MQTGLSNQDITTENGLIPHTNPQTSAFSRDERLLTLAEITGARFKGAIKGINILMKRAMRNTHILHGDHTTFSDTMHTTPLPKKSLKRTVLQERTGNAAILSYYFYPDTEILTHSNMHMFIGFAPHKAMGSTLPGLQVILSGTPLTVTIQYPCTPRSRPNNSKILIRSIAYGRRRRRHDVMSISPDKTTNKSHIPPIIRPMPMRPASAKIERFMANTP